jgi:drug/metabolite transporter (DMT)-like permease
VDPLVVALVAISAVMHVAWNIRLKTAGDPLRAATIGMLAGAAAIVPVGIAAWFATGQRPLPMEGIALGLVSGVIEACYFVLISAAYRRGDLSVVYPIARGTAPLLAVAVGVGVLGERLGLAGTIGVVALLAGFLVLQQPWRVFRDHGGLDPSVAFALATGVTIAAYSALDRVGTRLIDPLPYAAILWVTTCVALLLWMRLNGGELFVGGRAAVQRAAVGGWLTLGAYLLILFAFSVAPLSGVAPLRESATVFAAGWGSVRLGEAIDRGDTLRRVGASCLIVGGAILLAIGGR